MRYTSDSKTPNSVSLLQYDNLGSVSIERQFIEFGTISIDVKLSPNVSVLLETNGNPCMYVHPSSLWVLTFEGL